VEGWYNPHRLHSAIGYQSPRSYEREYHSRDHSQPQQPPLPVAAWKPRSVHFIGGAPTRIKLYNTLGQQVATVYEDTPQAGEKQTARFDVSGLSSGTYFLRLKTNEKTATRRVTVVR
jgi:hypothetical protein